MKSTDCVAAESTPQMEEKVFNSNQVSHKAGPRQTAKTQITDIRFSRLIKVAAEKFKRKRRRVHRLNGKIKRRHSNMDATKADLMEIAHRMHNAMVYDNKTNNGVLRAARMGAWLTHRPTSQGLVPLQGAPWDDLALVNSRLGPELVEKRLKLINNEGKPTRPDWSEFRSLRERQRLAYIEQNGNAIKATDQKSILGDSTPINGFISFLGGYGYKPFNDGKMDDEEEERGPCLTRFGISAAKLADNAIFQTLHPRVQQAILLGEKVSDVARCSTSRKNGFKTDPKLDRLRRQTEWSEARQAMADKVAKVGLLRAREMCQPERWRPQAKARGANLRTGAHV